MMRRVLFAICCAALFASPAFAQQTGQINGVVTDNTGGVVPGATVKAVETATGIARETVSGADGRYNFASLRPTTYDITAELTGFRTAERKGVLLQANQNLTANFALELGNLAETVTVAGQTATVDITSATISEVVDSKRIVDLPLNGRDAAKLSTLVPGMVLTEVVKESAKTIPGALRLSTNGTESRQVSFRLDGTSHTDPYFQQNQPFPFPDALQEFSIQTSNYSAGQGNSAGAVVNAVTRSGTNAFHGGAFDYVRDGKWNAKNFFATTPDFLKRKQYGGYVGGPVKHNHTFFFTGWQGTQLTNVGTTKTATIPTIDQRNGIFTTAIKDPTTCNAAGQNCQNFSNNTIPLDRMDPASLKVLAQLPLIGGNGIVQIPRRIGQHDNQFVTKVDQLVGQKNQFSGRYFFENFSNDPTFTTGNLLTYSNPTLQSHVRTQNGVGSWTRTFTPTLLNEVHFGYNRMFARRWPPSNGVPSMTDLGVRLPTTTTLNSIEEINAVNFFNIGDNNEAHFTRWGEEFNDRLTWVKGKHNLQVGGEAQHYNVQIRNNFKRNGHFQFNGSYTGNTLADFLLGYVSSLDVGTGEYKDYRVLYASAFAQDDFKVSSRLTLNLGFRLESSPPWHEILGRIMKFSVADYSSNVHSVLFPAAPRGETFRGDPGFPTDGVQPASWNPAPRVGFAWDLTGDGKTSLRGGGGIFFDQHRDGESGNNAADSPPWAIRYNPANPSTFGATNLAPFNNVFLGRPDLFPVIDLKNAGTTLAPFPTPIVLETLDSTYQTPRTYNYNLTLEREVLAGIMVRAAYVGSRNRHGRMGWAMNYADKNAVINGVAPSTANTDARRLFAAAGLGQITLQRQDRSSNYNSMQLTASKRYSDGFTVSGGYTLSKVVGDFPSIGAQGGGELIPYNQFQDPALVWGPLDQDHRHRFTMSWVWDLPGQQLEGPVKWVLGGWQWTGVTQYQTGAPFTVISGFDSSLDGIANDRAQLIPGVSIAPPAGSDQRVWFNGAAFTRGDLGTFGNVPKGAYYGPPLRNWDMGLIKNFKMGTDTNVQFRAEFFNIFNQVNFATPNIAVNNASTLGKITTTDGSNNGNSGEPRILQFGLKFAF
jgi:hypothetical protein